MYVILVYDVNNKKVNKIHKFLKKRLHWVQNSVFEWEINYSEYFKMKVELQKFLREFKKENPEMKNNIIIYIFNSKSYINRDIIWDPKWTIDYIL